MPEQQAQQGQGTQAGEGGGTWNTAIKIIQVWLLSIDYPGYLTRNVPRSKLC